MFYDKEPNKTYTVYQMPSSEENTKEIARNNVINELKKMSKSLLEEAKNEKREKNSKVLIGIAKNNFETAKQLLNAKAEELKEKKYNPFAKFCLFMAKNFKVYLGSLGTINKIYRSFDSVIGNFAKSELIPSLTDSKFYKEKDANKLINPLKEQAQKLLENNPDSFMLVICPHQISKRRFDALVAFKGTYTSVCTAHTSFEYCGLDKNRKPTFLIDGRIKATGIKELTNKIIFTCNPINSFEEGGEQNLDIRPMQ